MDGRTLARRACISLRPARHWLLLLLLLLLQSPPQGVEPAPSGLTIPSPTWPRIRCARRPSPAIRSTTEALSNHTEETRPAGMQPRAALAAWLPHCCHGLRRHVGREVDYQRLGRGCLPQLPQRTAGQRLKRHAAAQLMRVGCALGTCQVQNLGHRLWLLKGQSGRHDSSPMNPNSPHSYG
uniref:ADM2 n=1 Tax=Salvator merianae TaxID=96440 RepID=A0A8D0E339_SALMN